MFRKIHIFFVTFLYITANILQADQFDETPYCNKSWGEFSLRGDFLYWKPHVSCLELDCGSGIITQTITDGTQVVTSSEFDIDPSGKWNGGYRVAAGYRFANPQWEIEAIWTDFHGKACRSSQESPSISNETKYCVSLEQIDSIVAYNAALAPSFIVRPFFGVRGTRIHQNVHAKLVSEIIFSSTSTAVDMRTLNDKQTYYGIGPLLGLQADWDIICGFGAYGTLAAGLLYGNFDINFDDIDVITPPIAKNINTSNKRHVHAYDCNIDLVLGLYWRTFLCNSIDLVARLGFEHHEYFNQNRLGVSRGDVSFNGAIASLDIGF